MTEFAEITLARMNGLVVNNSAKAVNKALASSFARNIQALGFIPSRDLFDAIGRLSDKDAKSLYASVIPILKKMVGAHVAHKPFYPNFPAQVMEASEAELFFNALYHYWTSEIPIYAKNDRFGFNENVVFKILRLLKASDISDYFNNILSSSLSPTDKEAFAYYVENGGRIEIKEPPFKENLAFIWSVYKINDIDVEPLVKFIKSATDILRIAVARSGGDISLAVPARFISLPRSERRLLISILNSLGNIEEDIARHKGMWNKLFHSLHVFEYPQYTRVCAVAKKIAESKPIATFNSKVENAVNSDELIRLLQTRPGEFARRLHYLIRNGDNIYDAFKQVAHNVSTPVLLQARAALMVEAKYRVFMPKGSVAKAYVVENALSFGDNSRIVNLIEKTLVNRFSALPSLGKVYIDPILRGVLVPFGQRSASKALFTLARGSRIPIDADKFIRMFVWWKNGDNRTDIDLSALTFSEDFLKSTTIAYYHLRAKGMYHSGDIVNAPDGASEFIDFPVNFEDRYVAMVVKSYTQQSYADLPECFAGWMERKMPQSGEVYEAKSVINKFDITAPSITVIPVVFDLKNKEAIWCDMPVRSSHWINNVATNKASLLHMIKGFVHMNNRPSLYDLLHLHAIARGKLVNDRNEARTIFDLDTAKSGDIIKYAA